ncbi:phosphate starvation-inducible PhoH-like protein [Sinobacterium caligoides]|uniref:Phosphate starvation-inducible PhoH-like protein n=1 Tax=Sinobacterium caligoides TaxID=933926 RepID=A0A3N2DMF7_9GAMM|nr:PhoH family protein [Sinobacterium caligoides]ROS00970.1 phosphate starvation-inducible PhoH-like protein [Sinobacterium caligoides]
MAKRAHAKRNHQRHNTAHSTQESRRKSHRRNNNIVELHASNINTAYSPQRSDSPLTPRTLAQQQYIKAIHRNTLTFGTGPAGTGKSYCAGALAAQALDTGQVERIIITRPAIEAGEQLGFLPGTADDKFSVYIDAFRDILNERLGAGTVDYCLRHGRIVAAPLAYMRGKTFDENSFVILDEAQNTTPAQMKMFLSRIGEGCKVVVNGDIAQSDIRGLSGLADAVRRLNGVANVATHQFSRDDIVRSGLVRDIIDSYED